jgi:hypothetical protein
MSDDVAIFGNLLCGALPRFEKRPKIVTSETIRLTLTCGNAGIGGLEQDKRPIFPEK